MNATTADASPEALRAQMVDRILARQSLPPPVEAALRTAERHRFVPDAPLDDAYAEQAVITHTFPHGTHLSCASGPSIVAGMLNALDVRPGQRILEIGAGTGYNAALLAIAAADHRVSIPELVQPFGGVAGGKTTGRVEIDYGAWCAGFGHVITFTRLNRRHGRRRRGRRGAGRRGLARGWTAWVRRVRVAIRAPR